MMRYVWFLCLMFSLACNGKDDGKSEQANDEKSADPSTRPQGEGTQGDEGCTFSPKPCPKTLAAQNRGLTNQSNTGPKKARPIEDAHGGQPSDVSPGKSPGRGAENAQNPAIIVEWSDFRCGHCGTLAETLKDALRQDPTAFRYHFRHFPLDRSCNPTWSKDVAPGNSCQAAYAMVCADQQGKAWDMHDRIFDNQMGLQNQAEGESFVMLRAIAQDIGLNMDDFNLCLEKPETKNTVQSDIDAAREVGIKGTPLWFMNGVKQKNDVTARIVLRLAEVARARAEKDATGTGKIEARQKTIAAASRPIQRRRIEPDQPRPPMPILDTARTPGVDPGARPGRGAKNAPDPAIIVKWSDFRCGHCAALAETLKDASKQDPTAFRYHFRHFPLDRSCNPTWSKDVAPGNSCQAAYAMVCAEQQGKAWDMHDRIFDNQMGLQRQAEGKAFVMLRAIAKDIGLNMDDFNLCLEKPETKNTVQSDIDAARAVGIQGTPLWFMNGVKQKNDVTARIVLRLAEVARQRNTQQK